MRFLYSLPVALLTLLTPLAGWAQSSSVGIGTTSPNPKAALDIAATGKGLLIPRMDSATRAGISAPPDGLMVFQTDGRKGFWYAVGGAWVYIPDKTKSGDNLGSHTATQNLVLNSDYDLLFRESNDGNHGIGWYGGHKLWGNLQLDGPALYGFGGGVLGTNDYGSQTSTLYWSRERVGIGTTDPRARLDVDGTTRTTNLQVTGGTPGVNRVLVSDANGNASWQTAPGDHLGNHTATQNLNLNGNTLTGGGDLGLHVSSSGKVGIGANSTGAPLEVYTLTETLDQSQVSSNGGYAGTQARTQTFTAGRSAPLLAVSIRFSALTGGPATTTVSIAAGTPSGCATGPVLATATITPAVSGWVKAVFSSPVSLVAGNVYAITLANGFNWAISTMNSYAGGTICGGAAQNDFLFMTYVGVPDQMLAVTADGVGVKTSTPQAELDVAGTVRATDLQVTAGAANGRVLTSDATGNASWQALADPSATNEIQNLSISGSTISLSNGGGSVTVPSSADNLGNHTATQNLSLAQRELRLSSAADANHALFYSADWNGALLDGPVLTGYGGGQLGINRNGALSSVLRWTSTGRVGIGTTAPGGLLHLAGSETGLNGFNAALRLQNTAATTANIWTVRAGGAGTATPDGGFSIADNNNYRFSITNGGLVGIGTTAPAALLHVSGAETSANGRNAAIRLANTAATTPNSWIMRAGGGGTSTPDGGFSIADDNAYRLTITAAGRVGIGTTAPASELDVDGNLRLQGQSSTTEGLLVADAQGDVQRARHYAYTKSSLLGGSSTIDLLRRPSVVIFGDATYCREPQNAAPMAGGIGL